LLHRPGLSYSSRGLVGLVEVVGGAVPGKNGVASGQCLGRVVVVGETGGEENVEMEWMNAVRYGRGLSGMRAGKYGTGNVRDGSGCRVAGGGTIVVRVEGRG
jgi:hypothetical protein